MGRDAEEIESDRLCEEAEREQEKVEQLRRIADALEELVNQGLLAAHRRKFGQEHVHAADVVTAASVPKADVVQLLQGPNSDMILISDVVWLMPHVTGSRITGIQGGNQDRRIVLINASALQAIQITHNDSMSLAQHRFDLNGAARDGIAPKFMLTLVFDRGRWHPRESAPAPT